MNKVLVKVFIPIMYKEYEIWLPVSKTIYNAIILILKGINELNNQDYSPDDIPLLYNKINGKLYDINDKIQDTDIKNGTELIFI